MAGYFASLESNVLVFAVVNVIYFEFMDDIQLYENHANSYARDTYGLFVFFLHENH